jgi:hypothetical protein
VLANRLGSANFDFSRQRYFNFAEFSSAESTDKHVYVKIPTNGWREGNPTRAEVRFLVAALLEMTIRHGFVISIPTCPDVLCQDAFYRERNLA